MTKRYSLETKLAAVNGDIREMVKNYNGRKTMFTIGTFRMG
jgi:hypothetical protein